MKISHSLKCGFVIPMLILCSSVSATFIRVDTKTISQGDAFTIDVICIPSEPLKAWEFRVDYNHSILSLVNITEGDFFDGYQTFFIANGSIAYDLTLGRGNMTDENGSLAHLCFLALAPGITQVSLLGAGVTNSTQYTSIGVLDGTVIVMGVTGSRLWNTIKEGDNTFGGPVVIHGWSMFRNHTARHPTDQTWSVFLGVVAAIGFAVFLVVAALRKFR